MAAKGDGRRALLVEDPDLAAGLSQQDRGRAAESIHVPTMRLDVGSWSPAGEFGCDAPDDRAHLGFLVLDGLLLRRFDLGGAACAELLGAGDLLRPWSDRGDHHAIVSQATWRVLQSTELAVLDGDVARAVGAWPVLVAALLDRLLTRAHALEFHLAVCGVAQLEVRLLAVLWNLADRWGRMTPDGVRLPLRLNHEVLAVLVSARRPSVSAAMGRLRRRGSISDDPAEGLRLHGEAPTELEELRRGLAGVAPPPEPGERPGCDSDEAA